MKIYVRSRKDAKALAHLIEKVYKGAIEIRTFGGSRGKILEKEIEEIIKNPSDFTIILLGKEDKDKVNVEDSAIVKVHYVPKAKVRNVKFRLLLSEIEKAKFRFILDIKYEGKTYILGKKSNFIVDYTPRSDIYLVIWESYKKILDKHFNTNNYPLVLHQGQVDLVFSSDVVVGRIFRPLDGPLKFIETGLRGEDIDFEKFIQSNQNYLDEKIRISISKIKKTMEEFDFNTIVVPWSGGKDSTTILILLKYYTNLDFVPIFVDTGLEFKETQEYLDYISKKLGINYEHVYAGIDQKYKKYGYEFLRARKCTQIKIKTLYKFIESSFENPLIINGDRIPESEARSFRSELRKDIFYILSPIKYWSYLDEQLLFLKHKIEFHPLYQLGFYRLGCHVCPFIDSFEKFLLGLYP